MLDRMSVGEVARKHHIQLRSASGELRFEECFTRDGFDGPYTILYHQRRPHVHRVTQAKHGWTGPVAAPERPLAKRHYKTFELQGDAAPSATSQKPPGGPQIDARIPLVFNADVISGVVFPTVEDPVYIADGDADQLLYIHRGGGTLRTLLGDVPFTQGDYVFVPRGLLHRFIPSPAGKPDERRARSTGEAGAEVESTNTGGQYWLWFSLTGGLHVPKQWRNDVGQLRMDAPYSHRDFTRPTFTGPLDEKIRDLVVRRSGTWHGFSMDDSPLDVVGWDGTVYPWAFPILNFQPRVSSIHLPPTWHGTFAAKGALICSFVPRLVDFHPEAIPCPYPHSNTHCDEIIFYCEGNFTSRKGVSSGSISHHPMGVPHGPHPGSYEKSIGSMRTDEIAVMVDLFQPLSVTAAALNVEDASYQDSFL